MEGQVRQAQRKNHGLCSGDDAGQRQHGQNERANGPEREEHAADQCEVARKGNANESDDDPSQRAEHDPVDQR